MGCSGGKPRGVEASMEDVRVNPVKALPNLKNALSQPTDKSREEATKQTIPKVFELMPKALSSLSEKDKKATVAACDVIKCCVKLANDPAIGVGAPAIDASNVKQCVSELTKLLQKATKEASTTYSQDFMEDEGCSVVAESIAAAMKALFELEDHGTACRQQMVGSENCTGGLKIAAACMKPNSGMKVDARKAIVNMLLTIVETPEGAKGVIQNGCMFAILPYCAEPVSKFGITRDFQSACMGLLQRLLNSGQDIENRDEVEAAVEKAKNRKNSM